MKNKILSVAVPCYNSQDYMRKCIDSILVGGEEVEIIIVNDGSTDDTAKIAEEYKKNVSINSKGGPQGKRWSR